ncbi:Uncharacterised protein [uncultured archaeon]|nr:Uncharacterised protein [uncultured archaeon]
MRSINDLVDGDYIAFGFDYNGGEPSEIIVDKIQSVYMKGKVFSVTFLYGYKSLTEYVNDKKILAIGNEKGRGKIPGWKGNYDIINQEEINRITKIKN